MLRRKKKEIGILAQNVIHNNNLLSVLSVPDENNKLYKIKYDQLTAISLAAIKELLEKINKLENDYFNIQNVLNILLKK